MGIFHLLSYFLYVSLLTFICAAFISLTELMLISLLHNCYLLLVCFKVGQLYLWVLFLFYMHSCDFFWFVHTCVFCSSCIPVCRICLSYTIWTVDLWLVIFVCVLWATDFCGCHSCNFWIVLLLTFFINNITIFVGECNSIVLFYMFMHIYVLLGWFWSARAILSRCFWWHVLLIGC